MHRINSTTSPTGRDSNTWKGSTLISRVEKVQSRYERAQQSEYFLIHK